MEETMNNTQNVTEEHVGDYATDPRDGDQYEAPRGEALGPKQGPIVLPEDNLIDGKKFSFSDPETIQVFEESVIKMQVPGYDLMRLRALQIGYQFLRPDTAMLDLGTSRGKMIRDLIQVANERDLPGARPGRPGHVTFVGIDNEKPMLDSARAALPGFGARHGIPAEDLERGVVFQEGDLRKGIPSANEYGDGYSLVTSILTIQFVPVEYRQMIVKQIYDNLAPGGAFIFVEKVIGSSYETDRLLVNAYHDMKRRNGISEEAILKKSRAIESFLVPNRDEENKHLLVQAGFRPYLIDTYWRDLNFAGTLALKG